MLNLGKRVPCPKCNSPTSVRHCDTPKCSWYMCYKCYDNRSLVIFDFRFRYFVLED